MKYESTILSASTVRLCKCTPTTESVFKRTTLTIPSMHDGFFVREIDFGTSLAAIDVKSKSKIRVIRIPNSVQIIHDYSFANLPFLERVEFYGNNMEGEPTSDLIMISEGAFKKAESLYFFPFKHCKTLYSISKGAFSYSGLEKVNLENNPLETITQDCFSYCRIKEIKFPSMLTKIEKSAFIGNELTELDFTNFPDINIEDFAFSHNLLTKIQVSPYSMGIRPNAFCMNDDLKLPKSCGIFTG